MAELINNREHRIETLKEIIQGLHRGEPPAEVKRKVRGRRAKPVAGSDDGATLYEARRRKEAALAGLRELELAKARGELLPAEDVRRADEAIYAALRDRLRSIPMSLAPLLVEAAHKPNPEQGVYTLMLSSIDEALTDIADAEIVPVDASGNEIE